MIVDGFATKRNYIALKHILKPVIEGQSFATKRNYIALKHGLGKFSV